MSSKGKVASVRVKDVNVFELTPGLADAFTASLDASYLEYFTASCSGMSTKEAERRIAWSHAFPPSDPGFLPLCPLIITHRSALASDHFLFADED
jgi:hypothetical protein